MNIMRSNVHIDAKLTMLENRLVQLESLTQARDTMNSNGKTVSSLKR